MILAGAEPRGLAPGSVTRRHVRGPLSGNAQHYIEQAVTGYVSVELAVRVASALEVLPARTVVFEVEPAAGGPSDALSAAGTRALEELVTRVEREARRTPVLLLADRLAERLAEADLDDSDSLATLKELLAELQLVEERGQWGKTFALKDRLVETIRSGRTSEVMSHLDWSLWWGMIEELSRLAQIEAAS